MPRTQTALPAAMLIVTALLAALGGCQRPEPSSAPVPPAPPTPSPPPEPAPEWGCVYHAASGLRWVSATGGRAALVLTDLPEEQTWSAAEIAPNGQKVAFVDADRALRVADLPAGGQMQVSPGFEGREDARGAMAWSPDSEELGYIERGDIHLANLEGWNKQLTTTGDVGDLAWSPDGSKLAFCRRDKLDKDLGLWVVGAEGGEPRQLVPGTGDVYGASFPSWSPNGKTIAFAHAWEGGALCFVQPDGGGARLDLGPAWGPLRWLEDGSAVIYDAAGNEVESEGVALCTVGGQPRILVSRTALSLDVLPSGDLLMLEAEDGSDEAPATRLRVVVIRDAPTSTKESWRAPLDGSHGQCAWRPDGKAVAAYIGMQEGNGKLYTGHVGGELKTLATDALALIGWAQGPLDKKEPSP